MLTSAFALQVYERAIANIPPAPEKRYWQRYIYLWINYALFEELQAQDMQRTREVYSACLKVIPHKVFTFAKVYLPSAHVIDEQLLICPASLCSLRHHNLNKHQVPYIFACIPLSIHSKATRRLCISQM